MTFASVDSVTLGNVAGRGFECVVCGLIGTMIGMAAWEILTRRERVNDSRSRIDD